MQFLHCPHVCLSPKNGCAHQSLAFVALADDEVKSNSESTVSSSSYHEVRFYCWSRFEVMGNAFSSPSYPQSNFSSGVCWGLLVPILWTGPTIPWHFSTGAGLVYTSPCSCGAGAIKWFFILLRVVSLPHHVAFSRCAHRSFCFHVDPSLCGKALRKRWYWTLKEVWSGATRIH